MLISQKASIDKNSEQESAHIFLKPDAAVSRYIRPNNAFSTFTLHILIIYTVNFSQN